MSTFLLPSSLHLSKGLCTAITKFDHGFNEHKSFSARIHCCNTASATSSSPLTSAQELSIEGRRNRVELKENQIEDLVTEFGWRVRRLTQNPDEMREVAQLQAEAFHTPTALFDDFFFEFFKAEVLSGLLHQLKNSPPDRYACLVAEPAADSSGNLVGIVDATVVRDRDVMQHLGESQEYLYVSGIAVSKNFRRRKIATVLLKACDALCVLWGLEYLALRAYEDDIGARKLYANAGYRVVSSDPQWMAWTGRRRRVLMVKRCDLIHKSVEISLV